MPITTGFTTRGLALKGKGHIHTDKWHRCVEHVKAKGGGYEPHAVCTHAIGYTGSINEEHRTPGPHASANTRRFKESAKRRREAAEKQDVSYLTVLKWNESKHPRDAAGQFTNTGGPNADDRHIGEDAGTIPEHAAAEKYHMWMQDQIDPALSDKHGVAHAAHGVAAKLHFEVVNNAKPRQVGPPYPDPYLSDRAQEASYTANNITAGLKRKGFSRAS